jgi:hypothetical protein
MQDTKLCSLCIHFIKQRIEDIGFELFLQRPLSDITGSDPDKILLLKENRSNLGRF